MKKCYYVPLEQINIDDDIYNPKTYFGNYPYDTDYSQNRLKGKNLSDLYLIVKYEKNNDFAYELITNYKIPVKIFHVEKKQKVTIPFYDTSVVYPTYIRNVIIDGKSINFNKNNNLSKMALKEAKHILEVYKINYPNQQMPNLLEKIFAEGNRKLEIILNNYEEKIKQEKQDKKEIKKIYKELKYDKKK